MNPIEISRLISELSDSYYKASLEAGEIASRSGLGWLELRQTCKTDGECNRRWLASADGKREAYLKYYLKGVEKKVSALKLELRILTGQGA